MRYLQAFLISLVATVLLGRALIPVLRRLKAEPSAVPELIHGYSRKP